MEKEQGHMTEILDLTLEIVYLLTGENYIAFKLSDGLVPSNVMKTKSPIIDPPSHSMRKNKKVEDVTHKMIELLMREVPIRCQDVMAPFYTEEQNYIEGQKHLYKDTMTFTPPDVTSKRNPSERCARPLYSREPMQEHQEISEEDQVILEINQIECETDIKEEAQDPYVICDDWCKEKEVPPEISTDPEDTQRDLKGEEEEEEEEGRVRIKVEDIPIEIVSDEQMKNNVDECSIIFPESPNYVALGDGPITPNLHPAHSSKSPLSDPSTYAGSFLGHLPPVIHHTGHKCYQCGKSFSRKDTLALHQRSHKGEKPHSCPVCGKCFLRKWCLINHQRTHTGEKPFVCTVCGKDFMHRSNLVFHQRSHSGYSPSDQHKPFTCTQCGKSFKLNSGLLLHQRTHSGVKPYSCTDCGKCFAVSSALVNHKRTHTGERPYSCSQCGKRFTQRTHLVLHERTHIGMKAYPYLDGGKSFTASPALAKHTWTNTEQKFYSCAVCGIGFTQKEHLDAHQKIHTS